MGSDAFTDFGSIAFDPVDVNVSTTDASAVRAVFAGSLSGVDAIRFDFPIGQENGYAGIGELDVLGIATIPEPATTGLMLVGATLLLPRKRRRV